MQYILTEKEYNELLDYKDNIIRKKDEALLEACRNVANLLPINVYWEEEEEKLVPWGCIKDKDYQWYCDECPVRDICPEKNKEWSK
jgi:endonuclease III